LKILVINTGSSSIKYQFFDMEREEALASGIVEKIGETTGRHTHEVVKEDGRRLKMVREGAIPDHREGFHRMLDLLVNRDEGIIREKSEVSAVGHRVVHGGETFKSPVVIDDRVLAAIRENIPLAPLHNPPNLTGIEVARAIFPDLPQVAVFDTTFHQSMPERAYLYALPYALYKKDRVRRYGFHGTSHAYVAERAAEYLGSPLHALDLITIHLGNGASMAALKHGRCIDTSMGMTPLEGLVMGTRSGDLDPALLFYLADHLKMSLKEIDGLLNHESGLKGICGTNDMREIMKNRNSGDPLAGIAVEIYTYRVRKYIGAYFAALEDVDGLVFTAGIGENVPEIRDLCCRGLSRLGITMDPEKNNNDHGTGIREIHARHSKVSILIVPTNEELKIAQETRKVVEALDPRHTLPP